MAKPLGSDRSIWTSLSSSVRWLDPSVRTMGIELCLSLPIVSAALGVGVWRGLATPLAQCTAGVVAPSRVFFVNFALCLLLLSGVLNFGASTLVAALYVLVPTGSGVGAIVGGLGWDGAALLIPHGIIEIAAWVVATAVGLHQPANCARRVMHSAVQGSARAPILVVAGKAILLIAVLLASASLLEWKWTGWYGHQIGC